MKRETNQLLIVVLAAMLGWMAPSTVQAAITGHCADCHVMHASQGGVASAPQGYLLNDNCLGCHTGTNDGGAGDTPFVYDTADPTATSLAGGNFYFSENGAGDRKGHNPRVADIGGGPDVLSADATLIEPPGWKEVGFAANDQVGTGDPDDWAGNKLSCSGVYGCHGRHNGTAESMHHVNATGLATTVDGSTLGKSFRFLYGIKGGEDDDYQWEKVVDHNVYFGDDRVATNADSAADTTTMSYFCAECHGVFHSGLGATGTYNDGLSDSTIGSPWIRHPVDFSMPNSGEYANYGSYDPLVPLATSVAATALNISDVSAATDRIVMCLSCHYAHAGPNDYALRWNPADMAVGAAQDGKGCFACHTAKDNLPLQ